MTIEKADVSVVIPTVGRPELVRAIQSVRQQNYEGRIEVIVVFDRSEADTSEQVRALAGHSDQVLFTGGGKRAGYARNRGINCASAEWIAFLDDDDEWLPNKLKDQFDLLSRERHTAEFLVVGSRAIQRSEGAGRDKDIRAVPKNLIQHGQPIEEYLFHRRRAGARRNSFFTPTILAPTTLCRSIPWDESLRRHQDWDWMVRLGRHRGVKFLQIPEEAVVIAIGSGGSISAGTDWASSLKWATTTLRPHSRKTFVEFLAAQTLRYALHSRALKGVVEVAGSAIRAGALPSITSVLVGLSGLVRRTTLERLMHRIK